MSYQMPGHHQPGHQQPGHQQKVLYKADPNVVHNLKSVRDTVHKICRHHVNQYVRVETLDGQVLVGRIVSCDKGLIYIAVPKHGGSRSLFWNPFYNPHDELILTLVLYELLVITLLYG